MCTKKIGFIKKGFKSFHQAFVARRIVRRDTNAICDIIECDDGTFDLTVSSFYEKTQNYLSNNGFLEI